MGQTGKTDSASQTPARRLYRVKVQKHLNPSWLTTPAIVGLTSGFDAAHKPVSTLTLSVADQAELMGVLVELHGMGLPLTSIQALAAPAKRSRSHRKTGK